MADPVKVTSSTVVTSIDGSVINAAPAQAPGVGTVESPMNFEMYCSVKGFPPDQWAGRRAFTRTQMATLPEWDAIFAAY